MTQSTVESNLTAEVQECIQKALDCQDICLKTFYRCVQREAGQGESPQVRLLLDCAEICRTTASFLLRGSELYRQACALCAETCDRCAWECVRIRRDKRMKECAEACLDCAEACRRLSAARDKN